MEEGLAGFFLDGESSGESRRTTLMRDSFQLAVSNTSLDLALTTLVLGRPFLAVGFWRSKNANAGQLSDSRILDRPDYLRTKSGPFVLSAPNTRAVAACRTSATWATPSLTWSAQRRSCPFSR
jgi:hypothetical protein